MNPLGLMLLPKFRQRPESSQGLPLKDTRAIYLRRE